ncbi:hypothetical protein KR054_009005 [Drosophila jambulina]|nr:hypothetical protein KR054_009005 [Drosophila jambulina]
MPVQEMADVWANFYHGLRRCLAPESRTVATQLTTLNPRKKSRNRRRLLGIGRRFRPPRCLRESHLNPSEESVHSEIQDFSTSDITVSLTSCQELPCLQVLPRDSLTFLKRQQLQKQLQERPLIQNAIDVLQVQWAQWWHTCWPALMTASVQVSFGSSRLCHSLMGLYDEEERDPPILVLASSLGQYFKKICKLSDTTLCYAGPGPIYRTTSATMELIDIRELIKQINEALVDYLLTFLDSEISF